MEDGKVKHHCPACRHVIPSKRHIIKDPNFDDMIRALKCSREDSQPDEKIDISTYQQNHRARVQEMKTYQAANKERILSQPYKSSSSQMISSSKKSGGLKRGRKPKDSTAARSDRPASPVEPETFFDEIPVNFSLKYYNPQVGYI